MAKHTNRVFSAPRARAAAAVRQRLKASVEPITRRAIEDALAGDMDAARDVLDRVLREPGDPPISFHISRQILNKKDAELAMMEVLTGAAEGRITLTEARALIKTLREYVSAPDAPGTVVPKKNGKEDALAIRDEVFRNIARRMKVFELRSQKQLAAEAGNAPGGDEQGAIKDEGGSSALSAPDRATAAAQQRLEDAAPAVTAVAIDKAMTGNRAAAKLVMDKALGTPADKPISFPIRPIRSKQDAGAAMADVLAAVAEELITQAQADAFLKLLGDVVGAPEVPPEVLDTRRLDKIIQSNYPRLIQRAAARTKEGGEEISPYQVWLEIIEEVRRNSRLRLPPWP